jgi:D-alanine-D-alanine ligase
MRVLVLHSDVAPDAPPEEQDTLVAADAVADALAAKGHLVSQAAFSGTTLDAVLTAHTPDIVFNLVEGVNGLGRLAPQAPAMLAERGVRFTGVRAGPMDLTNDKPRTKQMLRDAGLATPAWSLPPDWGGLDDRRWIVKAALEDASLGLDDGAVVTDRAAAIARADRCAARFGGVWFAEEFIEGREFNIALLQDGADPRILPIAEMRFESWPAGKPRIVGYDAKWDEGSDGWNGTVRHFGVEQDEPELAARLRTACLSVWPLFDLTGFVRVDLRVDAAGTAFILEINANPGIAPDAGFAAAAQQAGMPYPDLIEAIVMAAA